MRWILQLSLVSVVACVALLPATSHAQHRLGIELFPTWDGAPLAHDTIALVTDKKQRVSVTRCDMLLSAAALQRESGDWITANDWAAFVSTAGRRTSLALASVPAGKFSRLRFHVGVPPEANARDPAGYAAGHPLNPNINGMHWGWSGGYVFAAIEGRWRDARGIGGYSYHIATDANLMTVELPLELDLQRDQTVKIRFDAARVFDGIEIDDATATTHSRKDDPLAIKLRANLERAFSIVSVTPTPTREEASTRTNALIGKDATPFRLTFSAAFPQPQLPLDNPLTNQGVALGKRLFHELKLSGNGSQSCASCHSPSTGLADVRRISIGSEGDSGTRNSMPLFNLAWKQAFFWDGRAPTLRAQALQPIENPAEMHSTLPEVVVRLRELPQYPPMFDGAFGGREITADRIARALEQFMLSIVSHDSKFDRAMRGGARLAPDEQRGFELFNSEFDPARGMRGADCFHCHGGPLFRSTAFANNGLDEAPEDKGRGAVTHSDGDAGKFAVPSLRNVALTSPYMHDGRFVTLEDVVAHYDHGVKRSATLDPNLAKHPRTGLGLSAEDQRALVAFLRTLTDERFASGDPLAE